MSRSSVHFSNHSNDSLTESARDISRDSLVEESGNPPNYEDSVDDVVEEVGADPPPASPQRPAGEDVGEVVDSNGPED